MKDKRYLNEEDLMQLIADVEEKHMVQAPFYLKQEILHKVRVKSDKDRERALKRYFFRYSFQVALATAAAILVLIFVPVELRKKPQSVESVSCHANAVACKLRQMSSNIAESLTQLSNLVLIKEEQKYEKNEEE
ncbi:hypothetical protein [[Clostridium] polysaccharolyticum]|uniref:Uncharacterized protein n=1 Tax=[Clostridium] polysaccharolyticum TaxID=29364 RepID=A0A1I0B6E0_9FIRM|nr:hypothetical protein [[Clostridium] polysaccharolyticum]SET01598.1 hypothetical protein SAMN04487772_106163 [[Clostridium] polysaccharolyticum]